MASQFEGKEGVRKEKVLPAHLYRNVPDKVTVEKTTRIKNHRKG